MSDLISADDVMASLPKGRRKAIEVRGAALLAVIERATQGDPAEAPQDQPGCSGRGAGDRTDADISPGKRKDPRLSTMQKTVAAMGDYLTMIVTFPDQEPMILTTEGPPSANVRHS